MKETEIKPMSEREHVFRMYDGVYVLLRKLFDVPSDETVIDFYWNKNSNLLILETLKDEEKESETKEDSQ